MARSIRVRRRGINRQGCQPRDLPAACVVPCGRQGYTDDMPSLPKPEEQGLPVTTTVRWRFPAIHPEGQKFTAIAFGITLLMTIVHNIFFWPLFGLTVWVAAFFRDPIRTTPRGEDLIVSPADGLVTMIAEVPVPRELIGELGAERLTRVSVFMSVFVKVGDMVAAGQRIGLIRFGSRVDVYLPAGYSPQVALGQRAIAGETVLARAGAIPVSGVTQ